MKLISIVALAGLICFLGFLFLKDQVGTEGDATPLIEQVDGMVDRWRIDGDAPGQQLVTFIISDGETYGGPLTVPEPPPEKPGLLTRLKWAVFGRPADTRHPAEGSFAAAVGVDANTIDVRYGGLSYVRVPEHAKRLALAMERAGRTGAQVRVVSHGYTAVIALDAVDQLAAQGHRIQDHGMIAAAVDLADIARLRLKGSGPLVRPTNVRWLFNIWAESAGAGAVIHTSAFLPKGPPTRSRETVAKLDELGAAIKIRKLLPKPPPGKSERSGPPLTRRFRNRKGRVFDRPVGGGGTPSGTSPAPRTGMGSLGFLKKEKGLPAGEEKRAGGGTKTLGERSISRERVRLAQGWSFKPPDVFHPGQVQKMTPTHSGVYNYTKATVRGWAMSIGVHHGWDHTFPGDLEQCGFFGLAPSRSSHRGYPVEICSLPKRTVENGTRMGDDHFLLRDGRFAIRVSYSYATSDRSKGLEVFRKVCASLRKD